MAGNLLDVFRGLNRDGKRRLVRSLRRSNRGKTKGAFGRGPFEKYPTLEESRAARRK